VLLVVGIFVSYMTPAVTTVHPAVPPASTPMAPVHVPHLHVRLHCGAAVRVLPCEDNAPTTDKHEHYEGNDFLF
jgi:hypothetical protein